jgi:hypothetical protein
VGGLPPSTEERRAIVRNAHTGLRQPAFMVAATGYSADASGGSPDWVIVCRGDARFSFIAILVGYASASPRPLVQ